jgi:hypothetical protein
MMASPEERMRAGHRWIGLLTVVVFLISGQFLKHHHPPLGTLTEGARLMLRSRHIYILASGLVNLMLGLYVQRIVGWRGVQQVIGSGLLMVSPALLVVAFVVETPRGFQAEMVWSSMGLYALFGGCMLHLLPAIRYRI